MSRRLLDAWMPDSGATCMAVASDRIMFEIYRETAYSDHYRVVYFTELNDHNRDAEINRALAGEHFYDGFIKSHRREEAKKIIDEAVAQLNEGQPVDPEALATALAPYAPP